MNLNLNYILFLYAILAWPVAFGQNGRSLVLQEAQTGQNFQNDSIKKTFFLSKVQGKSSDLFLQDSVLTDCSCATIMLKKDSLTIALNNLVKITPASLTIRHFQQTQTTLRGKFSSDEIVIKKKKSFIKLDYADVSDNLSVLPVLTTDSVQVALQNIAQSNFAFAVDDKYLFNGYIQYRKTFLGPLHDFLDFHIGYAGIKPAVPKLNFPDQPSIFNGLSNPIDSAVSYMENEIFQLEQRLKSACAQELLNAKQVIGNYQVDSTYRYVDSETVASASKLIEAYQKLADSYDLLKDQKKDLVRFRDRIAATEHNTIEQSAVILEELALDSVYRGDKFRSDKDKVATLMSTINSQSQQNFPKQRISRFGLGRIYPYQSELTLKNTSLRGVDVGYEIGRVTLSASAGMSDFQLNSFIKEKKLDKPVPYAVVFSAGYRLTKEFTTHFRYFGGRKDNYGAGVTRPITHGLSGELAFNGRKGMLSVEVAKNISQPYQRGTDIPKKSFWNLEDHDNIAIAVKSSLQFTSTRTSVSGSFAAQGKYYNAFNTFSANTQTQKYDLRISQDFWRGILRVTGWLRNAEYTPAINGFLLQNEVTLKSLNATFRKPKWPTLSVGYNPVKQVFISDSTVEVAIYQAATLAGSFHYNTGVRPSLTTLTLNRLGGRVTGGQQGYMANSFSLQFSNMIDFTQYSTTTDITYSSSIDYQLGSVAIGTDLKFFKAIALKMGLSITMLNKVSSKVGGRMGMQATLGSRGGISMDYNLSYLPSLNGKSLREYNMGSIAIRYILTK